MFASIFFVFIIYMANKNYKSFDNKNNSLKNIKLNDDYSIIKIETIPGIKASIDVRLKREFYKSEIEELAYILKNQLNQDYENIFICYYMPGMKVGNGAWATSHFNPDLDIFMTSKFYDDTIKKEEIDTTKTKIAFQKFKDKNRSAKIIGNWYEGNGLIIIFYKKRKKYYLIEIKTENPIIGKPVELLIRKSGTNIKYIIKDLLYPKDMENVKLIGDYTDYYKIERNGDLSLYDKIGLIERYKKLN